MRWKDFFYFSKGERQALTLLLLLIALTWIGILYTDYTRPKECKNTPVVTHVADTIRSFSSKKVQASAAKVIHKPREKAPTTSFRQPKPIHSSARKKKPTYQKTEKYPKGTVLELNAADTTALKKIPGIGSTFAKRIVKYRNLLGGFYTVEQLSEVYGIDEEKYKALRTWFTTDPHLIDSMPINHLSAKEIAAHPYINYKQAKTIEKLVRKKGTVHDWNELILLEEFPQADQARLVHYFSFD